MGVPSSIYIILKGLVANDGKIPLLDTPENHCQAEWPHWLDT